MDTRTRELLSRCNKSFTDPAAVHDPEESHASGSIWSYRRKPMRVLTGVLCSIASGIRPTSAARVVSA